MPELRPTFSESIHVDSVDIKKTCLRDIIVSQADFFKYRHIVWAFFNLGFDGFIYKVKI